MSTIQTLINRARSLNNVDSFQYPNTDALEDINVIYHQIEDFIKARIGEGYFWDIMFTDLVNGRSEYRLPSGLTGSFNEAKKVEAISIKYTSNGSYIPVREVNRQLLDVDLSELQIGQSFDDPIYFIADDSYFIYPTPKNNVTDGIKFYGYKSLIDVELTTTYDNIFGGKIPQKYYYILSEGLEQFILKRQNKKSESEMAKDIFEKKTLIGLLDKLGNRRVGVIKRKGVQFKD